MIIFGNTEGILDVSPAYLDAKVFFRCSGTEKKKKSCPDTCLHVWKTVWKTMESLRCLIFVLRHTELGEQHFSQEIHRNYSNQCVVLRNFIFKNVVGFFNSAFKKLRATRTLHNTNAKCKSNLLHRDVDQQYLFKYW